MFKLYFTTNNKKSSHAYAHHFFDIKTLLFIFTAIEHYLGCFKFLSWKRKMESFFIFLIEKKASSYRQTLSNNNNNDILAGFSILFHTCTHKTHHYISIFYSQSTFFFFLFNAAHGFNFEKIPCNSLFNEKKKNRRTTNTRLVAI